MGEKAGKTKNRSAFQYATKGISKKAEQRDGADRKEIIQMLVSEMF